MSAYDTLSGHIECWRADRPSEWIMDEFILKARKLEAQLDALKEENAALRANIVELEEELGGWMKSHDEVNARCIALSERYE